MNCYLIIKLNAKGHLPVFHRDVHRHDRHCHSRRHRCVDDHGTNQQRRDGAQLRGSALEMIKKDEERFISLSKSYSFDIKSTLILECFLSIKKTAFTGKKSS